MGWATYAKEALHGGETVQVRPRDHSMSGKVNDGDRVTLAPADPATLKVGDIVLVRVHGTDYLHLIKAINHPHDAALPGTAELQSSERRRCDSTSETRLVTH